MGPRCLLIAPDSWKGSLSAEDVATAFQDGFQQEDRASEWTVECLPLADGGEGTLAVVQRARGGTRVAVTARDAFGRPRVAHFLMLDDGTAVIEAAAGPGFVPEAERPRGGEWAESTGLGELLAAAAAHGATHIIVGLGGSGSSDGGLGLLRALGAHIEPADAVGLVGLAAVRAITLPPWALPTTVWHDVTAPLTGPAGAIRRYGPQKGLAAEDLDRWDAVMAAWGSRLSAAAGREVATVPGAGAAGGLGAAFLALGATLVPGGRAVAEMVGLAGAVGRAHVVVTSEGRVDAQSAAGKVVGTVVDEARRQGRPVIVAAPGFSDDPVFLEPGVVLWPVLPRPMTLEEARAAARPLAVAAGRRLYYGLQACFRGCFVGPPVQGP